MAHAFYAIAEHGALCYSPFGIEDVGHIQAPPPDAVIQSVFQTFEGRDTSTLIRGTYGILRGMDVRDKKQKKRLLAERALAEAEAFRAALDGE